MLSTEAFNALLKTLEEPPPHVDVRASRPPSRTSCRSRSCRAASATTSSWCRRARIVAAPRHGSSTPEKLDVEPGALSLVVRESGGSVRDALSLCDQVIAYVGDGTITEAHVAEVLGVADRALTRALGPRARGGRRRRRARRGRVGDRARRRRGPARARDRALPARPLGAAGRAGSGRELIDASDEERAELRARGRQLERSRVHADVRSHAAVLRRARQDAAAAARARLRADRRRDDRAARAARRSDRAAGRARGAARAAAAARGGGCGARPAVARARCRIAARRRRRRRRAPPMPAPASAPA